MNEKDLQKCIEQMQKISSQFYDTATRIQPNNHAFIEFCGLMNEYIKICQQTLSNGVDFTTANKHGSNQLSVFPHNVRYMEEKLNCIFDNVLDISLTLK